MAIDFLYPQYEVVRNNDRCINCRACERQCANEVHFWDADNNRMQADESKCVACHRCVALCPTRALKIVKTDHTFRENANWTGKAISEVYRQAGSGGVLLSSMGNPDPHPIYWDKILINASQVTNPSIDPLREPMETKTFLGKKPGRIERDENGNLVPNMAPQLELNLPIMFSAMSYGSISYNAHAALARAASALGTYYNTGEGGLHQDFYQYGPHTIVQVASGRFGVHKDYLEAGAAIEIKMGQGAKPGIGGHLPGLKVGPDISKTRMIPEGTDAISPAPHHDIYSIEDLRQLVYSLKEATEYKKPVMVKIAAVNNVAAVASGVARCGCGHHLPSTATAAAPARLRPASAITSASRSSWRWPLSISVCAMRASAMRFRSLSAAAIRNSADRAQGYRSRRGRSATSAPRALLAMGCHLCRTCQTGKCNWGIATQRPELVKRLNPDIGSQRLINLLTAWDHELKEMMGGMGINSIEALRGNRLMLRGIGLTDRELNILGIKHAGE